MKNYAEYTLEELCKISKRPFMKNAITIEGGELFKFGLPMRKAPIKDLIDNAIAVCAIIVLVAVEIIYRMLNV
jgi:hypothetical protein